MRNHLPIIVAALAMTALCACELGPFPKPPPQPEPPSPWDTSTDAAPPPEDLDASAHTPCYLACKQLKFLGCKEAEPTAAGATCTQVCTNLESSGVVSANPNCVARAETCSIAKACSSQ